MYQQLMDCLNCAVRFHGTGGQCKNEANHIVLFARGTRDGLPTECRRSADGVRVRNGMPSSPRQPLNNARMRRQFILYIDADCDVPTTNGLSELHCCSSPAGRETDCRRSADGVRVRNGMPSSPRQPLNNARMRRQFILYINADCTNN
jgi:hypothetical protein